MEILLGMTINKNKSDENQRPTYAFTQAANKVEAKDDVEAKEPKSILQRLIIPHNSKWKRFYDFVILICVGYSCFSTVYYAAFGEPTDLGLLIFDYMVEVLFGISLILNFFHAYKDPETNKVVTDIKSIAYRYLSGWFLVDFLSIFPFYLFVNSKYSILIQLLRILRMPKLMELIDVKKTKRVVNSFFENASREEKVLVNHLVINFYRIVRLIVLAAIITYFFG